MNAVRPFLIALGALTVAFGCDRSPTDASQAPALNPPLADLLAAPSEVVAPFPCFPLPPASVTQVIGSAGGSIAFGPHKLVVPSGALAKPVSITAVVPSDTTGYIEVRFYPDGLKFRKTVYVTISYAHCDLATVADVGSLLANLKMVYIRNGRIVETIPAVHDATAQTVTGGITHFSNYAIAW